MGSSSLVWRWTLVSSSLLPAWEILCVTQIFNLHVAILLGSVESFFQGILCYHSSLFLQSFREW